jgi:hypothetical protein
MGDPVANRSGPLGTRATRERKWLDRMNGCSEIVRDSGGQQFADAPVSKCPGVTLGAVDCPIEQFRAV